jgi:hypothetical protein
MSVICTVAAGGAVYLSSGALAGLASAAAGAMALRRAEEERGLEQETGEEQHARVELAPGREEQLSQLVAERCHLRFEGEEMSLELHRDIRGRLSVNAHSEVLAQAELMERSERFLGLLMQQVAYREVVTRMKRYGLEVSQEQRLEDGTVRVRIGRG